MDDERDPGQNTDAAFKLVLEAAVAAQRKPKTASKRLEMGLFERAIVAQAKEIHRLELFEQARDDFYNRRGNQPFSRKPWRPDPRLTGELPPYRNSRIECNGRNCSSGGYIDYARGCPDARKNAVLSAIICHTSANFAKSSTLVHVPERRRL